MITKTRIGSVTRVCMDGSPCFGQIKKDGRMWHAEIRGVNDGCLKRFAGLWETKHQAIEEVADILADTCELRATIKYVGRSKPIPVYDR